MAGRVSCVEQCCSVVGSNTPQEQIHEPHFDGNLVCGFTSQAIRQETLPLYECLESYKRQNFGPPVPSDAKSRVSPNVEWEARDWEPKQSKRHNKISYFPSLC